MSFVRVSSGRAGSEDQGKRDSITSSLTFPHASTRPPWSPWLGPTIHSTSLPADPATVYNTPSWQALLLYQDINSWEDILTSKVLHTFLALPRPLPHFCNIPLSLRLIASVFVVVQFVPHHTPSHPRVRTRTLPSSPSFSPSPPRTPFALSLQLAVFWLHMVSSSSLLDTVQASIHALAWHSLPSKHGIVSVRFWKLQELQRNWKRSIRQQVSSRWHMNFLCPQRSCYWYVAGCTIIIVHCVATPYNSVDVVGTQCRYVHVGGIVALVA